MQIQMRGGVSWGSNEVALGFCFVDPQEGGTVNKEYEGGVRN